MKLNFNFANPTLNSDGTPDYAPAVIRVPTYHHEEWDEPVIDPETEEPIIDPETGEQKMEHKSRDWTTYKTEVKPSAADYAASGYVPVEDKMPSEAAQSGYHWEASGWDDSSGKKIARVYVEVVDPPPPPRRWTRLSIKTALAGAGLLEVVRQYLQSEPLAEGYCLYEALTDCDYVEEGYPDAATWDGMLNGAAQAMGKSRGEIDAFLDGVPTEGGR